MPIPGSSTGDDGRELEVSLKPNGDGRTQFQFVEEETK